MANHSYVTSKRNIKDDKVQKIVEDLIKNKFNNLFKLHVECNVKGYRCWDLEFKDDNICYLTFWQETKRKIEFRNPHITWMWWILIQIQEAIALEYDGFISDDAIDEKTKPANEYPKFKDWVYKRSESLPLPVRRIIRYTELTAAPKEIRKL